MKSIREPLCYTNRECEWKLFDNDWILNIYILPDLFIIRECRNSFSILHICNSISWFAKIRRYCTLNSEIWEFDIRIKIAFIFSNPFKSWTILANFDEAAEIRIVCAVGMNVECHINQVILHVEISFPFNFNSNEEINCH